MSDRQPSEEPEEQVDLEGDDDVMDDEEGYRRRRHGGEDSDEPEEEPEEPQIEVEGDGDGDGREEDAGMAVASDEPAAASGDEMEKGDEPEDEEEKMKWEELLALPPQGSEVFVGGLPRDTTEEDLRELCEPLGEIFEVLKANSLLILVICFVTWSMLCDVCDG
uniref:RRM domain-containing protein n=1 Tax=Aegilops tauschii subsp. strangulata TaxID=200361 RepID=A0A453S267_AEGTS